MARCFISLDIDKGVREEITKIQQDIASKDLFRGKFTEKDNIHLTLKFLGEIDEDMKDVVKNRLEKIRFNRFSSRIKKAGVFSKKDIRIIWLALDDEEVLRLQKEVDLALRKQFPQERRFMGHITIARVKQVYDRIQLLECVNNINPDIAIDVKEFSLKESILMDNGPRYEDIERYELL